MKNKTKIAALILMTFSLSGCFLKDIFNPDECEHQWGPWEEIEKATCSRKGKKAHVCELCGEEREKSTPIDQDAHKWKRDAKSDVAATCTATGIEGSMKCSICGEIQEGTVTSVAEHSWVSLEASEQPEGYKESTCCEEGVYFKRCSECKVISDPIVEPVKEHEYIDLVEKNGVVSHKGCLTCDLDSYDFDVGDASGWNTNDGRMNSQTSPDNASTWTFNTSQVPAGFYDVLLEARCYKEADRARKFYNQEKAILAEDEEMAAADKETNSAALEPDSASDDDFRYTVKVDDTEYTPQQTKTWRELGLESFEKQGTAYHFVKFVDGITVNSNTKTITLCHKNIPTSLYCKSIRLVKHIHDGTKKTYGAENGKQAYEVESCSCGYRKVTINAKDGLYGDGMSSLGGLPANYIKLANNNDFIRYEFVAHENIVGDMYMVGRQDSYPSNKDKNPYNCSWYVNDDPVVFKNSSASSKDVFGEAEDPDLVGYSKEAAVLLGEVSLRKDDNIALKYVKTGEFNPAIRQIVIEGRQVNHICKWVRDSRYDEQASCTVPGKIGFSCECGKSKTEDSDTPAGHDYSDNVVVITPPTCEHDGEMTIECKVCHEKTPVNIPIPATHSMQAVEVGDGEKYKLNRCVACGVTEANWDLTSDMIQDLNGGVYSVSSTVVNKSGTMSNGRSMSVYKFDKANRKVDLSFYNNTGEAKDVTFKMLTTAKITDVANCKAYANRFEINVSHNDGSNHPVSFDSSKANKTLEDLGVKANKVSNVLDGNTKLADAEWIEYCTFTISAGRNTISFKVAEEAEIPAYIGGFALSYIS